MTCRSRSCALLPGGFPGFVTQLEYDARRWFAFWAATLFTAATRVWGLARSPWDWDEILFSLALRHYDVALLSQALHHADDPALVVREAVRILVPGGRILVLDLREHGETWVRERLGDRCLGFTRERLTALLEGAGLADVRVTVGARRTGDPFTVLIASGEKPAGGKHNTHG